jgi:prepilin peptidase CpaA
LVAAFYDLKERRIPNALTLPLLLAGLIKSITFAGLSGLTESIGACLMLALPFVLLFIFANGGAGDAKMMGAIGAWLGLEHAVSILLCVSLAGIILAAAKALIHGRLKVVLSNVYASAYTFLCFASTNNTKKYLVNHDNNVDPNSLTVPYGVAILAGVCASGSMVLL